MSRWRIEHIEPWSSAGPGWSNRGVTAELIGPAYEENGVFKEKKRTVTMYDKDLMADESLALSVALVVKGVLERAVMRADKSHGRKVVSE